MEKIQIRDSEHHLGSMLETSSVVEEIKDFRPYVEKELRQDVKVALDQLVKYLQKSGELDKYWRRRLLIDQNEKILARKRLMEQKKIEQASDFQSDGDQYKLKTIESTYSSEYGDEVFMEILDAPDTENLLNTKQTVQQQMLGKKTQVNFKLPESDPQSNAFSLKSS